MDEPKKSHFPTAVGICVGAVALYLTAAAIAHCSKDEEQAVDRTPRVINVHVEPEFPQETVGQNGPSPYQFPKHPDPTLVAFYEQHEAEAVRIAAEALDFINPTKARVHHEKDELRAFVDFNLEKRIKGKTVDVTGTITQEYTEGYVQPFDVTFCIKYPQGETIVFTEHLYGTKEEHDSVLTAGIITKEFGCHSVNLSNLILENDSDFYAERYDGMGILTGKRRDEYIPLHTTEHGKRTIVPCAIGYTPESAEVDYKTNIPIDRTCVLNESFSTPLTRLMHGLEGFRATYLEQTLDRIDKALEEEVKSEIK